MVDVPVGSKYASSVNHQMAYFMKRTFRKSGLQTFINSSPYAKIHCIGQKQLYHKLKVAGLRYDNNFSLTLQPQKT